MSRTGLTIALAIAAVTGLVFGFFPELDVALARQFFVPGTRFALGEHPVLNIVRDASMVIVGLLVMPAIAAGIIKLVRPQRRMLIPGRAVIYLITTLLIGPLLVANIVLKDHWGRPRPRDIGPFGGPDQFTAWWDPRGTCKDNCSFVAGEAAGAFWTIAPASLAPPQWRPLTYAGALAFGTAVGLLRMGFGGHFFSDVIFAGVLTFIIIWLVHGLIYRWPATRITDAAVEGALQRVGMRVRRALPFRQAPEKRGVP